MNWAYVFLFLAVLIFIWCIESRYEGRVIDPIVKALFYSAMICVKVFYISQFYKF
jgi:hypothetical protein